MIPFWRHFFRKEEAPSSYQGKIEVFSRHCFFSSVSQHKKRNLSFTHERCYYNLLETIDRDKANLTFLFDAAKGPLEDHFLKDTPDVITINEGTEAGAFLALLRHVSSLKLDPETILYFVEDDYLHRTGWVDILLEGFQIPQAEYITLYDHRDKYTSYHALKSQIFSTKSCHWRTTPSTTQTFATRYKTLMRDLSIHQKYSKNRKISADHAKFLHLKRKGITLLSSIPGWSTHAEPEFASPCVDWEALLIETLT